MLATSEERREREAQPEKPAPGLACLNLMMLRAEVERRGGASVDSGVDGERLRQQHLDAARDEAQRDEWSGRSGRRGVARRRMGVPPRGGLGRADGAVSCDERARS
jgi:hypothetical protein